MQKRIFSLVFAIVIFLSFSSVAFAAAPMESNTSVSVPLAGEETWDYTGYIANFVGSFDMTGRNLTPVKTIVNRSDLNRYLTIDADFTCNSASILTIQIVEYPSGRVLASASSNATTSGRVFVTAGPDIYGKQVQILFRVTDSNGNYDSSRPCHISYWYSLRGIN